MPTKISPKTQFMQLNPLPSIKGTPAENFHDLAVTASSLQYKNPFVYMKKGDPS